MNEVKRQIQYLENWNGDHYYGLQFGDPHSETLQPVCDLIEKHCIGHGIEIGSGGGRWTREIIKHCLKLLSVDGTKASKERIEEAGIPCDRIQFEVCQTGEIRSSSPKHSNFAFSFDTFVHFHPSLFIAYCKSIQQCSTIMLHYACYYPGQSEFNIRCFKYWAREDVLALFPKHRLEDSIAFPDGFGSELLVLQHG